MVDTQIIDRIEGNLVYLVGHKYPIKGLPYEHTVHVIGIIKKLILSWPFISLTRIKAIGSLMVHPKRLDSFCATNPSNCDKP